MASSSVLRTGLSAALINRVTAFLPRCRPLPAAENCTAQCANGVCQQRLLTAPAGSGRIADELAQRPAQHRQEDHRHGQDKLADVATLWQDCSNGAGQKLPGNNISMKRWTLERGQEFAQGEFWKTYWCRRLQADGLQLHTSSQLIGVGYHSQN
jgi:hypothetical protein